MVEAVLPIDLLSAVSAPAAERIPSPGLMLGLMLFVGIGFGYVAHLFHLPRVIGYLVGGIALKLAVASFVLASASGPPTGEAGAKPGDVPVDTSLSDAIHVATAGSAALSPVYDVVLGLILFTLGGVFERKHLGRVARRVGRLSLAECGITLVCVWLGCLLLALIVGGGTLGERCAFALLLGIAGIATAPAATLLVFREYQAKGPMTDTALTLVGLNNIVSTVLFHVVFLLLAATGVIESSFPSDRLIWVDLMMVTIGSVVLGALLGLLISIAHAKLSIGETMLVFMGILLALGAGRNWLAGDPLRLSVNFLLTSLFMGATFANIAIDGERLTEALRPISTPLFAAFFVLAGYDLHLEELTQFGVLGFGYVAFRTVGKMLGGVVGARWAAELENVKANIDAALLCQAGVAIGLAIFLAEHWPSPLAGTFKTIIFGSVAMFELSGPLGVKWVALRAGEIKAITLLRRLEPAAVEGVSSTWTTVQSMLRLVGLGRKPTEPTAAAGRPLQARDIMRTNVKFIPADATMDQVMTFVERSRFNHFPVIDSEGHLAGMIRFADIRDVIYDPLTRELITAVDLADAGIPLVTFDLTLDELLDVFHSGTFETLPVIDRPGSRKVLGIVEQRDLLHAIHHSGKFSQEAED